MNTTRPAFFLVFLNRPLLTLLLASFCLVILPGCSINALMNKGKLLEAPDKSDIEVEYHRNLLFTEVEVNGKKMRFGFDTGAPCVITPEMKEELGLKTIATHGVRGSSGQSQMLEFVRLDEFKVGEVVFKNVIAVVTDLSLVKCYEMDGLVGANAMRHMDWLFDLKDEKATAYNTDILESLKGENDFTINFEPNTQHTPVLSVNMRGMKSKVPAKLDMGHTGSISLKGRVKELAQLYEERTWVYGKTSRGIYGTLADSVFYFLADSVKISGQTFTNQRVKGGKSNLIGNTFFQDYTFLLSYKNKKVLLKPKEKNPQKLPSNSVLIGEDLESLRIMGLSETGAHLPLTIDDVILSINGEDMTNLSEMEICGLNKRDWPKLNMRIRKSDGSIIELELAREEVFK